MQGLQVFKVKPCKAQGARLANHSLARDKVQALQGARRVRLARPQKNFPCGALANKKTQHKQNLYNLDALAAARLGSAHLNLYTEMQVKYPKTFPLAGPC